MAKFSLSSYWHPTPKKVRKIGLAIASLGATIGAGGGVFLYVDGNEKFKTVAQVCGIAGPILGWLGKEVTNFWTDEESQNDVGV